MNILKYELPNGYRGLIMFGALMNAEESESLLVINVKLKEKEKIKILELQL